MEGARNRNLEMLVLVCIEAAFCVGEGQSNMENTLDISNRLWNIKNKLINTVFQNIKTLHTFAPFRSLTLQCL